MLNFLIIYTPNFGQIFYCFEINFDGLFQYFPYAVEVWLCLWGDTTFFIELSKVDTESMQIFGGGGGQMGAGKCVGSYGWHIGARKYIGGCGGQMGARKPTNEL